MSRIGAFALACLCLLAAPAPAGQVTGRPEKGKPYPAGPMTIPYEDVLDHCDLVLAGKIRKLAGRVVELEVSEVLKGKFDKKTAVITHGGTWRTTSSDSAKPPRAGELGVFMCLKVEGGLVLAGDPPKGGGFMEEGPELAKKLLEAARDPAKGFASEDKSVRLSSACRLARAWLAAPAEAKPAVPAGLMEALLGGLAPGELRGRHVNAAARDAINLLLDCDIIKLWRYSVNHNEAKREEFAKAVSSGWERTVKAVRERRAGPPVSEEGAEKEAARRAAALVKQLADAEFEKREAADKALRRMGKPAAGAVRAGTESPDAEVAYRCREILKALEKGTPAPKTARFDLDRAGPFVPREEAKPGK